MPDPILPDIHDQEVEELLRESETVRDNFRRLQADFDEIERLLARCRNLIGLPPGKVPLREVRVKVSPLKKGVEK